MSAQSDLACALDAIVEHLGHYVVFDSQHQPRAIALWLAYSHAINIGSQVAPPFDVVPYLLVTSPERQSGKSTLKDVLRPIAARGQSKDGTTPAALIRSLKYRPTLFIDEIDTIFRSERGDGGADNETIRAILNSGFHVNGSFEKVVMAKDKVESYPTFGPKALFGIGQVVPETVTSRSIRIRLQRKERGTTTAQRARLKRINAEGQTLHDRLRDAMSAVTLSEVDETEFDERLSDRAVDLWEPLYAVAEQASDDWPWWVREAAIELATGEAEEDDESLGEMLLRDIRDLLDATPGQLIHLTELVGRPTDADPRYGHDGSGLCGLAERPWGEYRAGSKPITPRKVASMLRGYGIRPYRVSILGKQANGFDKPQFAGAFRRYLGEKDDARAAREAAPASAPEGAEAGDLPPDNIDLKMGF